MKNKALNYLRQALDNPEAVFRPGQWESIDALLAGKRMLVVQRTGWGKSMVYFLGTKLLREQGFGPTLLVSPLLSLMRDQVKAAERIGVKAETINSANQEEWQQIQQNVNSGETDILLISPERLANENFRQDVLSSIAESIGMFVVDEAHCISDWGHDFRPDYKRIVRVLQAMPANVPVLATTATANDRVVEDVKRQIGIGTELARGSLARRSLRLCNINASDAVERMAWLAANIPSLPGSGIVYTLTVRDSERVTMWLRENDIDAAAYHAKLENEDREELERRLLNNEVKVLVATVALGMGFDKPDLGFVIHYQRPSSVVHYYQQVGRAGRAVKEAYGILFSGAEDDAIADYFITSAFPPQKDVDSILDFLQDAEDGCSIVGLEAGVNLKRSRIEKVLKFLSVESPSPVIKNGSRWYATAAAQHYAADMNQVREITAIRRSEQEEMRRYMDHKGCLMEFLQRSLDDPSPDRCGRCCNCDHVSFNFLPRDEETLRRAEIFLKKDHHTIAPRKRWPSGLSLLSHGFSGKIPEDLQYSEGRALCLWGDPGWGKLVAEGKYATGRFPDELVEACVEMIRSWKPSPEPRWVACVPSLKHPEPVPDFAKRLADALGIPFSSCIEKVLANKPQKEMENSFQQARNLDGAFKFTRERKRYAPCLLVDDMVDSRWTFTVVSALLRQNGVEAVHPLALALNSKESD
ncbi:RecQ family ATP-dependent DNA helicase [Aminivibrio sp.]|uniref:RecQ family ATP-dependent DNA helicase n=1 Tax=Aminivibrio sp. TaxID=1872489 RepID=UPI00345E7B8B